MNKTLLLVALSANFLVSPHSNADAICNDGWQSTSEGSGTCSWHGGVSQWYPDGTFSQSSSNTDLFGEMMLETVKLQGEAGKKLGKAIRCNNSGMSGVQIQNYGNYLFGLISAVVGGYSKTTTSKGGVTTGSIKGLKVQTSTDCLGVTTGKIGSYDVKLTKSLSAVQGFIGPDKVYVITDGKEIAIGSFGVRTVHCTTYYNKTTCK